MNTKESHIVATVIQWQPEHADEIIARLVSLGAPEDIYEVNGGTLALADGPIAWPGQWLLLACGRVFVVEEAQ
jgi:hypothetical protein